MTEQNPHEIYQYLPTEALEVELDKLTHDYWETMDHLRIVNLGRATIMNLLRDDQ